MSLQSLRQALSHPSTSVQLCLIGLAGGLIAAFVIISFRLTLTLLHVFFLDGIGNYASLSDVYRLALPFVAVTLIIGVAKLTGFEHYRLGIPFVIHRVKQFYGHIPLRTTINQFFGGIFALASGFVVGKEGPTVHLAAWASHYVGRWLKLPFNSLRILAGCGIAAGIAAAFNTPFAAVIFVMEVVLREYKVHIFVPIMLSAACGSVITRLVFGDVSELAFLNFAPVPPTQLPYLVLMGICIGIVAALFNKQLMNIMRWFTPMNMIGRLYVAAAITGAFGYFMPSSMGAEFINIELLLGTQPDIGTLLALFAAKFVLAIVAIALGVPGGIIGAVMVIGMLLGVVLMQPISTLMPGDMTSTYALLGMAGFLAAVLHAPMAALSAAMELAASSQAVLPAMIVIVSAYVTAKQMCNNKSIFIQQLDFQELPYTRTAIRDMLQQTGVMAMMKRELTVMRDVSDDVLYDYLQTHPEHTLIHYAADNAHIVELNVSLNANDNPLMMHDTVLLSEQHTLADVHEALQTRRQGAVLIQSVEHDDISGVITWNMVHNYLLKQRH
ncbi:chloride channel protein [Glaciecola sp. XM2]|uniref:chloride channel protein n=1 Tax=Glaciecola sp. XM2 TaxID=1914931 RepID=UPI001BDF4473|nr:chloride channel protein [Glaciecola sp. XM2]MBT1449809.1 chloride channel protein [Glaciecola sp. XM2]